MTHLTSTMLWVTFFGKRGTSRSMYLYLVLACSLFLSGKVQGKFFLVETEDSKDAAVGPGAEGGDYSLDELAEGNSLESLESLESEEVDLTETGNDYSLDEPAEEDDDGKCRLLDGPGMSAPGGCIFPFKWKQTGKTYNECTMDGDSDYWCTTKVNAEGYLVSGNWARCSKSCPGVKEGPKKIMCRTKEEKPRDCFIPFTIDGVSYRGCMDFGSVEFPNGFCFADDVNGNSEKAECSPGCPKDYFIGNKEKTFEELLKELMVVPAAQAKIEWDDKFNCTNFMEEKFKQKKPEDMPEVAKDAKDWKSALESVCKNAAYCAGNDSPACGSYLLNKRRNQLEKTEKGQNTPKADCALSCGDPNEKAV